MKIRDYDRPTFPLRLASWWWPFTPLWSWVPLVYVC